jgi:hypothetical protein
MMETEALSEALEANSTLIRLMTGENFIANNRRER